jgi:hypothetical protein
MASIGIAIDIALDGNDATAFAELDGEVLHIQWEDESPHAAVVAWEDFQQLGRLLAFQQKEEELRAATAGVSP